MKTFLKVAFLAYALVCLTFIVCLNRIGLSETDYHRDRLILTMYRDGMDTNLPRVMIRAPACDAPNHGKTALVVGVSPHVQAVQAEALKQRELEKRIYELRVMEVMLTMYQGTIHIFADGQFVDIAIEENHEITREVLAGKPTATPEEQAIWQDALARYEKDMTALRTKLSTHEK